jgi:hypothetical protein
MRKKKEYLITTSETEDDSVVDGPCPWVWKTSLQTLNFTRWKHLMGDKSNILVNRGLLLDQCRNALWGMRHEITDATIHNLNDSGIATIFKFIDSTKVELLSIEDMDEETFITLVSWLKRSKNQRTGEPISYVTARSRYTTITTILSFYASRGLFDKRLLPVNPFPNTNRSGKGTQSYSKNEMTQIMRALFAEYKALKLGASELTPRLQLAVYQLLITAKTGINQKPLEEATRDCLQPHPLRPDKAMVMLTRKRRGMNTHALSIRQSEEIENINGVPTKVAKLLTEAIGMTAHLCNHASPVDKEKIWLYESGKNSHVVAFKSTYLTGASKSISRLHNIVDDAGEPITISSQRLRKTFATRIWQLTNGDVWKTARILGNTPKITDRHYLEVTPEMERTHHFVGKALEINIRGMQANPNIIATFSEETGLSEKEAQAVLSGENNTGVSRCSSPYNGKYAKGDGTPCTRFLECFRCPNQIVLESDLYRLFSFYWLILKERNAIGRKRWKKLYSWVIREIDGSISNQFSVTAVAEAKQAAMINPHPMWKQRMILGAANG